MSGQEDAVQLAKLLQAKYDSMSLIIFLYTILSFDLHDHAFLPDI